MNKNIDSQELRELIGDGWQERAHGLIEAITESPAAGTYTADYVIGWLDAHEELRGEVVAILELLEALHEVDKERETVSEAVPKDRVYFGVFQDGDSVWGEQVYPHCEWCEEGI